MAGKGQGSAPDPAAEQAAHGARPRQPWLAQPPPHLATAATSPPHPLPPLPDLLQWQHLQVDDPRGSLTSDKNLVIRGNVVWNGGADKPLGVGEACTAANPTCNPTQVGSRRRRGGRNEVSRCCLPALQAVVVAASSGNRLPPFRPPTLLCSWWPKTPSTPCALTSAAPPSAPPPPPANWQRTRGCGAPLPHSPPGRRRWFLGRQCRQAGWPMQWQQTGRGRPGRRSGTLRGPTCRQIPSWVRLPAAAARETNPHACMHLCPSLCHFLIDAASPLLTQERA